MSIYDVDVDVDVGVDAKQMVQRRNACALGRSLDSATSRGINGSILNVDVDVDVDTGSRWCSRRRCRQSCIFRGMTTMNMIVRI
jgi:hypothetical protein